MKKLAVTISSFGYKYKAVPETADIIINCRPMDNPAKIPNLYQLNGFDERVKRHVLRNPKFPGILNLGVDAVVQALNDHRKNYHVAFGCMGGKHRSVVVAEALADRLREDWPTVMEVKVNHLEKEKWPK